MTDYSKTPYVIRMIAAAAILGVLIGTLTQAPPAAAAEPRSIEQTQSFNPFWWLNR